MLFRVLLLILIMGVGLPSFAHEQLDKREVYKTEDILLLFKSCYETIHFLGTTKYKRNKHKLTEVDVSKQCFCICDKIREKHNPKQFLVKPPLEIHNIIAPLTDDCLKETGQSWYDDVVADKENKDDS